jgi:hypothetical protein
MQFLDIDGAAVALRRLFEHEPYDGIGTAQRLEAAEAEPLTLILHRELADAELGSESGEEMERRDCVILPVGQEALDLVRSGDAKRFRVDSGELPAMIRVLVEKEHRRPCL